MHDHITDRLSEYLDGELGEAARRELERHLESCADCRTTLLELRAVKDRAGALVDPPAPDDLWAGIASRIGSAGSTSAPGARVLELPRRRAWTPGPALAIAASVAVVALAAWWLATGGRAPRTAERAAAPELAPAETTQLASFDAARVDGEIAQLQQALDRGRGKLDPATIQVLERNLSVIRQAAADARRALEQDPANRELQDYFAATVQSKLDLMRRATALAGV
jgi:anti-sigma factor RsiW